MNVQVTIGFNEEALSAISELTAAIRSVGGAALSSGGDSAAQDSGETGPIYWQDNTPDTGDVGVVDDEAAYKALKKKRPQAYKIPEFMYHETMAVRKKLAEVTEAAGEEGAADEKAAKPAKTEKAAAAKSKKAPAKTAAKAEPEDAPSEEDLIAVFKAYLPADLSKAERAERHAFVKPLLARFGAPKASELAEEHRALAINLVQRKMAGEDVDPETSEYEPVSDAGDADEDVI